MILVSYLDEKFRKELEDLVFFNEYQLHYLNQIKQVIMDFGIPKLTITSKGIGLEIEGLPDLQTIFFLDDMRENLIGFSLLYREEVNTFTLLHIGVSGKYNSINNENDIFLLRIMKEIMKILSLIKNVEYLKVLYCDGIKSLRIRK